MKGVRVVRSHPQLGYFVPIFFFFSFILCVCKYFFFFFLQGFSVIYLFFFSGEIRLSNIERRKKEKSRRGEEG